MPMGLRLRNASGADVTIPGEFLKKKGKRAAALLAGIEFTLYYAPQTVPRSVRDWCWVEDDPDPLHYFVDLRWEPVRRKPLATFKPAGPGRTLRPMEDVKAFEMDLADLFDLSRPGAYTLRVTFTKETAFTEGRSSWLVFPLPLAPRPPRRWNEAAPSPGY
jgi:hypothetical protein